MVYAQLFRVSAMRNHLFKKLSRMTFLIFYPALRLAAPPTGSLNTKNLTPKQKMGMLIMMAPVKPAARKELQQMAKQGNSFGQLFVGGMYESGIGLKQDYRKALYWIRKSAISGCPPAQYELGEMYRKGTGVPKSYTKAVSWYRNSANSGLADAQLALGRMYSHGWGVTRNLKTALHWYRESASYGNTDAYMELGIASIHGKGEPKNYLEAAKWLYLADIIGQGKPHLLLKQVQQHLSPAQMNQARHLAISWGKRHHQREPDLLTQCP